MTTPADFEAWVWGGMAVVYILQVLWTLDRLRDLRLLRRENAELRRRVEGTREPGRQAN